MPTISTSVTVQQTLSPLRVAATGSIRTGFEPAVAFDVAAFASLVNRGDIVTDGIGALYADLGGRGGTVTVENFGRMAGQHCIVVEGGDFRDGGSLASITNSGRLFAGPPNGATGSHAIRSDAMETRIENSGTVEGIVWLEGGEVATLDNAGTFVDTLYIDVWTSIDIRNTGRLIADAYLDGGTVTFANAAGARAAAVFADFGDDRVTNAGILETAKLGGGDDVFRSAAGGRVLYNVDGEEGDDRLLGGDHNDGFWGGDGDDTIAGRLGRDSIGGGDDADRLDGGDGNDTLLGGPGRDVVEGGDGADRFRLAAGSDVDFVVDFSADQGDRLDLTWMQLSGFDDPALGVAQTRGRTIVAVGEDRLVLNGLHTLDAGDFLF